MPCCRRSAALEESTLDRNHSKGLTMANIWSTLISGNGDRGVARPFRWGGTLTAGLRLRLPGTYAARGSCS